MERHEVRRIIQDELEERIALKECPVCDAETTMAKVDFWPNTEDAAQRTYWRCMKCLTLFEEKLNKVE